MPSFQTAASASIESRYSSLLSGLMADRRLESLFLALSSSLDCPVQSVSLRQHLWTVWMDWYAIPEGLTLISNDSLPTPLTDVELLFEELIRHLGSPFNPQFSNTYRRFLSEKLNSKTFWEPPDAPPIFRHPRSFLLQALSSNSILCQWLQQYHQETGQHPAVYALALGDSQSQYARTFLSDQNFSIDAMYQKGLGGTPQPLLYPHLSPHYVSLLKEFGYSFSVDRGASGLDHQVCRALFPPRSDHLPTRRPTLKHLISLFPAAELEPSHDSIRCLAAKQLEGHSLSTNDWLDSFSTSFTSDPLDPLYHPTFAWIDASVEAASVAAGQALQDFLKPLFRSERAACLLDGIPLWCRMAHYALFRHDPIEANFTSTDLLYCGLSNWIQTPDGLDTWIRSIEQLGVKKSHLGTLPSFDSFFSAAIYFKHTSKGTTPLDALVDASVHSPLFSRLCRFCLSGALSYAPDLTPALSPHQKSLVLAKFQHADANFSPLSLLFFNSMAIGTPNTLDTPLYSFLSHLITDPEVSWPLNASPSDMHHLLSRSLAIERGLSSESALKILNAALPLIERSALQRSVSAPLSQIKKRSAL
jgi:hypothetical protein